MIAWDLDPFRIGGGTAYAIRRLADQLNDLGIRVAICLPNELNATSSGLDPPLTLVPLDLSADRHSAPHWGRCAEFCEIALKAAERNAFEGSDAIVAHNDEAALFAVHYAKRRARKPLVFWLHSLYDPAVVDFSTRMPARVHVRLRSGNRSHGRGSGGDQFRHPSGRTRIRMAGPNPGIAGRIAQGGRRATPADRRIDGMPASGDGGFGRRSEPNVGHRRRDRDTDALRLLSRSPHGRQGTANFLGDRRTTSR